MTRNIGTIKTVSNVVLTLGVSRIVGNIIKATTPAPIGILAKVLIGVSEVALSCMIAKRTSDYVSSAIDELVWDVKNIEVIDI